MKKYPTCDNRIRHAHHYSDSVDKKVAKSCLQKTKQKKISEQVAVYWDQFPFIYILVEGLAGFPGIHGFKQILSESTAAYIRICGARMSVFHNDPGTSNKYTH